MAIKKEHTHKFRRHGLSIFCSCGDIRNLTCAHEWILDHRKGIQLEKMGGHISQEEWMYHCKNCGAVRHTNPIAGTTHIAR